VFGSSGKRRGRERKKFELALTWISTGIKVLGKRERKQVHQDDKNKKKIENIMHKRKHSIIIEVRSNTDLKVHLEGG